MGTISSEDPAVRAQLQLLVKTEKSDGDEKPSRGNITAAAVSESQLHRVEQELNNVKVVPQELYQSRSISQK